MATIPVYNPGGTVRTTPQRALQVDGDMFGAAQGRAMVQTGQQVSQLGNTMLDIEKQERQRSAATNVTDASTRASAAAREALFGDGGIYEQKGANAEGSGMRTKQAMDKIGNDVLSTLSTDEEKEAFKKVFSNYTDSTLNSVSEYEFKQRQATRTTTKVSALQNLTDDVIANYNNPDMLKTDFNTARGIVRANADGLPPEALDALERSTVSNMHLAVVQRLAIDSPGEALDYYTSNQGQINGVDHAKAQGMIGQISKIREVRDFVDQTRNAGPANDIMSAVVGTESSGDPAALSEKGAAGLAQLMPNTARQTAVGMGLSHVARMDDAQLQEYWKTPEGQRVNVRIGRQYLGQMINQFSKDGKADIEAALIAYNAGPANAEKWLNSGRDYDVLPKKGETLPYVQKVLSAWRGTDFKGAANSSDIQATLKGSASSYFNGDAKAFLRQRLQAQHGPEAVDGMSGALSDRMAAMINDAPDYVKAGIDLLSGYRSVERQKELWDKSDKTGKWVARPGNSQHNHGNAADLGWNGGKFSTAPKEVVDWVHANAGTYGLTFPMGYEPWHIETAEARKGGRVGNFDAGRFGATKGGRYQPDNFDAGRFGGNDQADTSGYVSVADAPANAANVYMDAVSPFTVDVKGGSLEAALSAARERFADRPDELAEAERQITNAHQTQKNASEEQVKAVKQSLLSALITQGKSPREADPSALTVIGAEGIKQLFSLEDDIKQGTKVTDPSTYIELVNMTPQELRSADLMTYAQSLSFSDLKKFADDQAGLRRGNTAAMQSSMQTRSQIVGSASDMLGLQPSKDADDAKTLATLNRRLDVEIAAYVEQEGKQPDGQQIQGMVDKLMMEGKKQSGFYGFRSGTTDRMFQVPAEEMQSFYAASTVDDIPQNVRSHVALTYRTMFGADPDEKSAVNTYNDMVRVEAGGAPMPPTDFAAQIRQRFVQRFGRPPLPEEAAEIYKKTLTKAAKSQNAYK